MAFDEFVEIVEKNIWSLKDIDRFCYGEIKKNNPSDTNLIIMVIMGIIIFILVIINVYLIIKLTHKYNISKYSDSKEEKIINDEDD